mmetsp:Transcript_56847/g.94299  ORF Transcript_56847/g.94299 Transcript_56847/m.94299 type:complete len:205 (+) Transcript_56847:1626-2240(+)
MPLCGCDACALIRMALCLQPCRSSGAIYGSGPSPAGVYECLPSTDACVQVHWNPPAYSHLAMVEGGVDRTGSDFAMHSPFSLVLCFTTCLSINWIFNPVSWSTTIRAPVLSLSQAKKLTGRWCGYGRTICDTCYCVSCYYSVVKVCSRNPGVRRTVNCVVWSYAGAPSKALALWSPSTDRQGRAWCPAAPPYGPCMAGPLPRGR